MADTIPNALLRREVHLQRFASHLINEHLTTTLQDFSRLLPSLLNELGDANALTITERNKITAIIKASIKIAYTNMWDATTQELENAALLDARHVKDTYKDFTGTTMAIPADAAILGFIRSAQMVLTAGEVTQSGVWAEFIRRNTDAASRAIVGAIHNGYTSGQTNQQIAQQIRGRFNRRTKKYEGGILHGRVKNQAMALVRTGTSHYSNAARDKLYSANKDVIQARILFATMDNRTSLICRGRHLMEWDIDDNSYPRLPFHFNERSQYIVRVKGVDPLPGTRPVVGGKPGAEVEDFQERPKFRGRRDTDIYSVKQIDADTTMDEWMRTQPRAFIESSIGKSRAKLFIDGKMSVNSFTDATGRTLTLDELKGSSANDRAFRLAGL